MKNYWVGFVLLWIAIPAGARESEKLCRANEQSLFECKVGKKQVSICASPNMTATTGYAQYRYGTPQKIELAYPPTPKPPRGYFALSNTPYSGGAESRIHFTNQGYEYFVFTLMHRTHFEANEPNYPVFDAGVRVFHRGKEILNLHCQDRETSLNKAAYDHFDQEAFDHEL